MNGNEKSSLGAGFRDAARDENKLAIAEINGIQTPKRELI